MKRVSKEDLNKATVKVSTTNNIVDKTGIVGGKASIDFIEVDGLYSKTETKNTVAKSITDAAGTQSFFVKVNRNTEIYHPNNIFYLDASERRAYQEGMEPYRLIKASKDCFDLYYKFLITKNPVFLSAAQKAMSQ